MRVKVIITNLELLMNRPLFCLGSGIPIPLADVGCSAADVYEDTLGSEQPQSAVFPRELNTGSEFLSNCKYYLPVNQDRIYIHH